VSVHYYGEPAAAAGLLAAAKLAAARPVIVGEAGRSTVDGAGADEAQARFFRQMALITQALALPPAAPWTLTDFSNSGVPAGSRKAERYYGLRRTDGSWKPAAAVVRSAFAGHVGADIDAGFEREVNGGAVLGSWSAFDATDGLAQVRRDLVRHGHAAACFSATRARPGLRPSITQSFPVLSPHQVTTAEAWVTRRAGKGTERIALAYYDSAGRYLSQVESRSAVRQIGWELLSVRAVAPQDATLVQLHLKAGAESGRACYDDIVVR
jgi:hypothetical protein